MAISCRTTVLGSILVAASAVWLAWPSSEPPLPPLQPAAAVPGVPLPGGGQLPMSGLGLCCQRSSRTVLEYLLAGGRFLDDATHYNNQAAVREALVKAAELGVPRGEVFLESRFAGKDNGYDSALAEVNGMLRDYGVDYLDLVMTAEPSSSTKEEHARCGTDQRCRQDMWRALQDLKRKGVARHIGVANFGPKQLEDIMMLGGYPVEVNEIEFHPWTLKQNRETVEWCHAHGIPVIAYGSLLNMPTASMTLPWQGKSLEGLVRAGVFDTLGKIAAGHNKTIHQVLLRWAIQHNVTVIPGTKSLQHMRENLNIFDFVLSAQEMAMLDSYPEETHFAVFPWNLPDRERYQWIPPR